MRRSACVLLPLYAMLATCNAAMPEQISLSVGNDGYSSMNVTWVTTSRTNKAHVKYQTQDGKFKRQREGNTTFYDFASVDFPLQQSGGIHYATMSNLAPDTEYVYQVGDETSGEWSESLSFTTLPKPGPVKEPFSLAILGDLGQTPDSKTTVQQMSEDDDVRFIVCVGDMSYSDTVQSRWDSYGHMVYNITSRKAWMVGPGNHEIESDTKTGNNFVPYEHRFNMPSLAPAIMKSSPEQKGCDDPWPPPDEYGEGPYCTPSIFMGVYDYGNSFYSYDAAAAHIINLNPYTSSSPGSPQGLWLAQDLAKVDRSKTPWLIVLMHCPWYNSNTYHQSEFQSEEMKFYLEPLLLRYRVDLVVAGHVHAYERILPVAKDKVTGEGITYVVIGGSGNREGHAGPFEDPPPEWSAVRHDTTFGHGKLTMQNDTHLLWVWYSNENGQKEPFDQTWIIRDSSTKEQRHLAAV